MVTVPSLIRLSALMGRGTPGETHTVPVLTVPVLPDALQVYLVHWYVPAGTFTVSAPTLVRVAPEFVLRGFSTVDVLPLLLEEAEISISYNTWPPCIVLICPPRLLPRLSI